MRRNSLLSLAFAGSFLLGTSASAQAPGGGMPQTQQPPTRSMNPDNPTLNNNGDQSSKVDDKKFAKDAAEGGLTEVELGKLALQKASSEDVKKFAQKMVDDHSKANDELKELATKESIDIPSAVDSKHQSRIDKLGKLSGAEFDKAYTKDQLKDHQSDVRAFSAEAQSGSDPNLKAFATSTLPTLQQHLEMVKTLNKAEK